MSVDVLSEYHYKPTIEAVERCLLQETHGTGCLFSTGHDGPCWPMKLGDISLDGFELLTLEIGGNTVARSGG